MILRSELNKIITNPTLLHIPMNSKFFYSESEAIEYRRTLKGTSKIDQWMLKLDDMDEDEKKQRIEDIEKLITQRPNANDAQRKLLRDVYYSSVDFYSVSLISELSEKDFHKNELSVLVYDDEINGAVRYE
jgi:hypothetical protein